MDLLLGLVIAVPFGLTAGYCMQRWLERHRRRMYPRD